MLDLTNKTVLDFPNKSAGFPAEGLREGQTIGDVFIDYLNDALLPVLGPDDYRVIEQSAHAFTATLGSSTWTPKVCRELEAVDHTTWFRCLRDGRFLRNGAANVAKLRDMNDTGVLVSASFKEESTGHGWQLWRLNGQPLLLPAGSLILSCER